MRPESQTSSGIAIAMAATDTINCHAGTPPSAIRIGISVGENIGISDMTLTSGLFGAVGNTETPTMYPMIRKIITGNTTAATSSWRDTSAATAANARAYAVKPSRNHTTSQITVLTAVTAGIDSAPVAKPATTPAAPVIATWISPTTPIPATFPTMSCHGRTVASSNSTTRLVFSSTTP